MHRESVLDNLPICLHEVLPGGVGDVVEYFEVFRVLLLPLKELSRLVDFKGNDGIITEKVFAGENAADEVLYVWVLSKPASSFALEVNIAVAISSSRRSVYRRSVVASTSTLASAWEVLDVVVVVVLKRNSLIF